MKDDSVKDAPAVVAALKRRKVLVDQNTSAQKEIRELDEFIRRHRALMVEVESLESKRRAESENADVDPACAPLNHKPHYAR